MSATPNAGNNIPVFTSDDLNDALDSLFSGEIDVETAEGAAEAATAFINLVVMYASRAWYPLLATGISFDTPRLEAMLRRFYRDAFGVNKFCSYLKGLQRAQRLSSDDRKEIIALVKRLGLRVSSDEPRKTKIVAAFALWLSALKPVHFIQPEKAHIPNDEINKFCARFNLWITENYLKKFGSIEWGADREDALTRRKRFLHDFTVRSINLSSFEFLYGSIFRATPESAKEAKGKKSA